VTVGMCGYGSMGGQITVCPIMCINEFYVSDHSGVGVLIFLVGVVENVMYTHFFWCRVAV
jgi:hypothetical protein